jgi:hypothetical protein
MNQTAFTYTRARSTDSQTSHAAAKNAAGGKAGELRRRIQKALQWNALACSDGLTAKDLARDLGADYYDVQRRLSETANIRKTGEVRAGAMVWEWVA